MNHQYFDKDEFFRQTSGNEEVAREISGIFCREFPADMDRMEEAFSQEDYETVRRIAHKSKSGFLIMGARELFEVAAGVERSIRDGNTNVSSHLEKLRRDSEGLCRELKATFGA